MTAGADYVTLSVLERRHIAETVREVLRREPDHESVFPDALLDDLREVLRILREDDHEDEA